MNVVGQTASNLTRGTRISSGYARKRWRIVSTLWLLLLLIIGRNAWNSVRNQSPPDQASDEQFMPAEPVNHEGGQLHAGSVTAQAIAIVGDPAEAAHGHPGGSASRRLLVATATVAAVGAVMTAAILAEHRMSSDRTVPFGKADTSSQSHSKSGTASIKTRRVAGPAATSSGRRLAWAPVANASTYTVEIVGGGDLIYSATTGHAYVRIPDRWRRNGRTMTLSAGTYHWYVWPAFGNGAEHRQSRKAIVASVLTIAP
jgi:hypothetical protein